MRGTGELILHPDTAHFMLITGVHFDPRRIQDPVNPSPAVRSLDMIYEIMDPDGVITEIDAADLNFYFQPDPTQYNYHIGGYIFTREIEPLIDNQDERMEVDDNNATRGRSCSTSRGGIPAYGNSRDALPCIGHIVNRQLPDD